MCQERRASNVWLLTMTVLPFVYAILSLNALSLVDSPRVVAGLQGYRLTPLYDIFYGRQWGARAGNNAGNLPSMSCSAGLAVVGYLDGGVVLCVAKSGTRRDLVTSRLLPSHYRFQFTYVHLYSQRVWYVHCGLRLTTKN